MHLMIGTCNLLYLQGQRLNKVNVPYCLMRSWSSYWFNFFQTTWWNFNLSIIFQFFLSSHVSTFYFVSWHFSFDFVVLFLFQSFNNDDQSLSRIIFVLSVLWHASFLLLKKCVDPEVNVIHRMVYDVEKFTLNMNVGDG